MSNVKSLLPTAMLHLLLALMVLVSYIKNDLTQFQSIVIKFCIIPLLDFLVSGPKKQRCIVNER